jgi:Protein of unknown function (DUF3096)
MPSQFIARGIVPETCASSAVAIFGIFRARRNPLRRQASAIAEPGSGLKCASSIRFPHHLIPESFPMTITMAHVQPIVALIAGILILIMPRFLNLVVAIYLIFIGLAGLGLFKMFKM